MILITGATGFLGTELIIQLTAQQYNVRAVKRASSKIPALLTGNHFIEWVVADINEPESLADAFDSITHVYHCAAFISFDAREKKKLFRVNIDGTSNVVNLCLENNIRLIHVSSVAALGDAKKGNQITEKDFWDPSTQTHSYAVSKYEGEMEVWRGIAEGLDAVIVNPSVIIGKNAGFEGSGAIFKLVKEGLKFYTDGASGFVSVEDVADAMILLMDSEITGERFIISAENLTYKQLFHKIAEGFEIKPPNIEAKPWMLGLAWRGAKIASWFTGQAPALTKDSAKSSFNHSYYSNQKIKKAIIFDFKPIADSITQICIALKTV